MVKWSCGFTYGQYEESNFGGLTVCPGFAWWRVKLSFKTCYSLTVTSFMLVVSIEWFQLYLNISFVVNKYHRSLGRRRRREETICFRGDWEFDGTTWTWEKADRIMKNHRERSDGRIGRYKRRLIDSSWVIQRTSRGNHGSTCVCFRSWSVCNPQMERGGKVSFKAGY